jgi:hypothetical protein
MKAALIPATLIAAFALASAAPAPASPEAPAAAQEEQSLSALIDRHLRSGGSWFTPAERAVIERKCGYAPGEWDGFEASMSGGIFTCADGRVVDDPEVRSVLKSAAPRIEARVEAVMARADVAAAISLVADRAAAAALREIEAKRRR